MRRSLLPFIAGVRLASLVTLVASLSLATLPAIAASSYPNQRIEIVVPFTAGGNTDTIARLLAKHMEASLKQSVIVVNRPGAGTNIGSGLVAKSDPDGYTMLLNAPASFVVNQFIYNSLPYDPDTAFAPACLAAKFPNVLVVNPRLGVKTIKGLIEKAKANPGKIEYAFSGVGTSSQLSVAMFAEMAGINVAGVPYKGTSQYLPDLATGRVAFTIDNLGPLLPFIKAGKLLALGVSTKQPAALLPGVPPIDTVLKGYELASWNVLALPAKTPATIVHLIGKECDRIVHLPAVTEIMHSFGAEPVGGTPEQTVEFLKSERPRWEAAIKAAKIQKQ